MADDLGYTDVACFGSKYYETANLDRLASQGMKLTNFHNCQNCAPTRAALMSGQYGARTGVYTVGGIDPNTDYPRGQYLADFLTDRAVDFIARHKDEPLFLYLPHFGVHSPYQAKTELIEKLASKPGVGGHNNPTYAVMVYSEDESVGRVMKTLDELQLAKAESDSGLAFSNSSNSETPCDCRRA